MRVRDSLVILELPSIASGDNQAGSIDYPHFALSGLS